MTSSHNSPGVSWCANGECFFFPLTQSMGETKFVKVRTLRTLNRRLLLISLWYWSTILPRDHFPPESVNNVLSETLFIPLITRNFFFVGFFCSFFYELVKCSDLNLKLSLNSTTCLTKMHKGEESKFSLALRHDPLLITVRPAAVC